ncbi:MAG TPA: SufE family protein, partial [Saprospiraceae bacterium]|nr:SufE family protein [Saprospiraceae bacterium]
MLTQVSSIQAQQEAIIEEFSQFTDWTDRYEYLIDMGKNLPVIDAQYKTDAYLVKGCQSRVWLHGEIQNHRLYLQADSDAVITKGIIALLVRVFSGQDLEEIQKADLTFIDVIGLKSHLSPTRSNGLQSMIRHIRSMAAHGMAHQTDSEETPTSDQKTRMIDVLKTVYDPEIPVDIWELGLIYELELDDAGKAHVLMTLTSPACP